MVYSVSSLVSTVQIKPSSSSWAMIIMQSHVIDPVVAGRTHVDDRALREGALHLIEDEQNY